MAELVPVVHGRLQLEVPEGWLDTSSVSFVSPARAGVKAPLSPKAAPPYQTNLTASLDPRPEDATDLGAFADAMASSYKLVGAKMTEILREPFRMGEHVGLLVERRVVLGPHTVRQLQALAFAGAMILSATASTDEASAAKDRPELLDLLRRVTLRP